MQAQAVTQCPFHPVAFEQLATVPVSSGLSPDEALVLPMHRRVVVQFLDDPQAGRELRLFYDDKEISFDEPHLFAFGQALAAQSRFEAWQATTWGDGYDWSVIEPLLAQLLAEGVLLREADLSAEALAALNGTLGGGEQPSPLPVSACDRPESWRDCETIMKRLTGRALEQGWLELVVPVFRVAHMAVDGDGRQVGESNVFPPALRLNVPTKWRTCIYPGTRFQVDRPMNVTALKTMRQHWAPMMFVLQAVRGAYLQRYAHDTSLQGGQRWTVGHIERLATAVLAVATYSLVRADQPVGNGQLHPVLSSVFRVTDGLRMAMHQMLFVPIGEPTLSADAPVTTAQILDYTERNYSFHSEHGVCAGPRAMVEEFLAVLVDGKPVAAPADWPPALNRALDELQPAIDYGLLGLQAYAAVFSLWPIMTRTYDQLLAATQRWALVGNDQVQALAATLQARVQAMKTSTYLAHENWRVDREQVYADMHAQCGMGLGQTPVMPLDQMMMPVAADVQETSARLVRLLRPRFGRTDGGDRIALHTFARMVAAFLEQERALLRVAASQQMRINDLLNRAPARRAFSARDIDLHNQLQGAVARRLPDLVADLEGLLGLQIELDTERLHIQADLSTHLASSAQVCPHLAGMVPAR